MFGARDRGRDADRLDYRPSVSTPPDLVAALQRAGVQDVSDSTLSRALYSSDASLYRVVPQLVVRPRHPDELLATLAVARESGVPLTVRGAGTSIAGNAVGTGIVVDLARHLTRIHDIDVDARTARVDPGVVHSSLQRAATARGLRFGPDPSTHTRCTIGGMIGNNACGSRALGYGRTSDNVVDLDVVYGDGSRSDGAVPAALASVVDGALGHVRTSFGQFTRQVSGYSLEHLLPERRDVAKFLVGSEGTLALVLGATVRLVEDAPERVLLALGYPSMFEAADAVPAILAAAGDEGWLVACEGLDQRIVEAMRGPVGSGQDAGVPDLPRGAGWLFVEVTGDHPAEALSRADRVAAAAGALDSRTVSDPAEAAALWRVREAGAGLAARSLERPAYSGWEDAAVPPARLGVWLRDFDELLRDHELDGVPYGHFGEGCVHARIDFTFDDGGARFRAFLEAATDRVVTHGGSISGEHGDGRARSELLARMYDAESLRLFGAVKAACDPDGILNPGVLVDPAPLDADLRPARPVSAVPTLLRLTHDQGSLGAAVHRCTGVGACVSGPLEGTIGGNVMCPSHQATRNEKDSTRGRARTLQEALDGTLVQGLSDPAVHEALDLCLACKGCARDCPTGVDMATYKAEVLHQTWKGRRRPRQHYTLGWLPALLRRSGPMTPVARRAMGFGPTARIAKAVAGIDPRRSLPLPAARSARRALRGAEGRAASAESGTPDVWLWADTFTDHFRPGSASAAIEVLADAGLRAAVIEADACCGLTWISTGQLDHARTVIGRAVTTLAPYVDSGVPVIGLEPSCLATMRSDAVELAPDAASADTAVRVAKGLLTLAELLQRVGWTPPDLSGTEVVAQPHCHHASVLGWAADQQLLERAGARVTRVGGCCGLAGNFGMEQGHYEVSVAVAETQLLPAVRANPDAVVLADGLSCRHQLDDLADVQAVHLAELFASRLGQQPQAARG